MTINEKFEEKQGYGYGPVFSFHTDIELHDQKIAAILQTLTIEQLNAIITVLLLGDVAEIGVNDLTIGDWTNAIDESSEHWRETEAMLENVAAITYLSGRLASEIPILKEKK